MGKSPLLFVSDYAQSETKGEGERELKESPLVCE